MIKDCLFKNKIVLKSYQRFKSEAHCVYTEEINKIVLRSSDDKRLQTFNRIATYPYGKKAFKDINKIYLYAKDSFEEKYRFLNLLLNTRMIRKMLLKILNNTI